MAFKPTYAYFCFNTKIQKLQTAITNLPFRLRAGEVIEWEGKPAKGLVFGFWDFENKRFAKKQERDKDGLTTIFIFLGIAIANFDDFNDLFELGFWIFELVAIAVLFYFIARPLMYLSRKRNTYYWITNDRLLIQQGLAEPKIEAIELRNIDKIVLEKPKNQTTGNIALIPRTPVPFKIYNLQKRKKEKRRLLLEKLDNPEQVEQLLQKLVWKAS